jgi:uncharacterized phage protein gp47/JayE
MPWNTPTLKEVRSLSRDLTVAYLPGADASVPNNVLRVVSDDNAALAFQTLLYLDWLSLQLLPDTAEAEWLDRHAQIWLGGRKAATYALGTTTLTGIDGTVVPVGTRLQAGNGSLYETVEQVTLSGPTLVSIHATTEGAATNAETGSPLALVDAVSGLDGTATVVLLNGGADIEADELLRARVLERIRKPPMGGSQSDYEEWAKEVPLVTRAWAAPNEMGIGTVTVRFMADQLRADVDATGNVIDTSVDGFPLPEDVIILRAYLDSKRPVAVKDFFVEAPIPQPIDMTISGLVNDTSTVRTAIRRELLNMLDERAAPGQSIYRSWVDEAISVAVGEDHHELTFTTTAMASLGHLAVLGTITYA